MKKFLLSLFVIISSIIYVSTQQIGNKSPLTAGNMPALPPTSRMAGNGSGTPTNSISYKDGQYTGKVADAYYGNIQVQAIIQNGKITDVQFLNYPQDRNTSIAINTDAMPILKSEAINTQSANVDIVSGATDTSQAFQESLNSALTQASA